MESSRDSSARNSYRDINSAYSARTLQVLIIINTRDKHRRPEKQFFVVFGHSLTVFRVNWFARKFGEIAAKSTEERHHNL